MRHKPVIVEGALIMRDLVKYALIVHHHMAVRPAFLVSLPCLYIAEFAEFPGNSFAQSGPDTKSSPIQGPFIWPVILREREGQKCPISAALDSLSNALEIL
jgi:hypothetical protein